MLWSCLNWAGVLKEGAPWSPSSSGLGHWPLTPETGVRVPLGTPFFGESGLAGVDIGAPTEKFGSTLVPFLVSKKVAGAPLLGNLVELEITQGTRFSIIVPRCIFSIIWCHMLVLEGFCNRYYGKEANIYLPHFIVIIAPSSFFKAAAE